jgi:LPS-assembly protein
MMILLWVAAPGQAQNFIGGTLSDPDQPWHLTADEISYDDQQQVYIANGNVSISKQDRALTADFVRFNHKALTAMARGNVMLMAGEGDVLTGERLEIDLNNETGTLYGGRVFLKENHFYITGEEIRKLGPETYQARRAQITTCDGPRPSWKITCRDIKVTIEGYGSAKHAAFHIGPVPVLYTPYLLYPAKRKRQSGFLLPFAGYSDRNGFEYNQPYFWAISPSQDATFYANYIQERGVQGGGEYRYFLSDITMGAAMFDYLDDQEVDDGSEGSSAQWGFSDDTFLRPNSERYWFRMKHDQELPWGFMGRLDLDVVSDQDYLTEFRFGPNGFEATDSYFFEQFGRDLDDYNEDVRTNNLQFSHIGSGYSFYLGGRWNDNVIARRLLDEDDTLQRLPFATWDVSKQKISSTPLFYDLNSQYTYFYREDGTRGHRTDIRPRLFWPLQFRNYFTLEPYAGFRETLYSTDWEPVVPEALEEESGALDEEGTEATGEEGFDSDAEAPLPIQQDDNASRELIEAGADFSTEFYRIFNKDATQRNALKHLIRPQVGYAYIQDEDQEDLPFFTSLDRIEGTNLITYSLTNTLISKRRKLGAKPVAKGVDDSANYTYHRWMRLLVEQSYDLDEEEEDEGPFSGVAADLHVSPSQYAALQADGLVGVYGEGLLKGNIAGRLSDRRGDRLFVEYRFNKDINESVYSDLLLNLTPNWWIFGEYEYNLEDKEQILAGVGIEYIAACWAIDLSYIDEEEDQKFMFRVNLRGLGGFGKRYVGRRIDESWED